MRKTLDPAIHHSTQLIIRTLALRRQQLGWSQQTLAYIMQTHKSTISKMESGEVMPGLDMVYAYAKAVDFDLELIPVGPLKESHGLVHAD